MLYFLLLVIIAVLLFGAAAIRAAIVQVVCLIALILIAVVIWNAATAVPSWFWVTLGLVAACVGLYLALDHRKYLARLAEIDAKYEKCQEDARLRTGLTMRFEPSRLTKAERKKRKKLAMGGPESDDELHPSV